MMLNSPSLNHAKVLLHLKWFINRLTKSFEQKLQIIASSDFEAASNRDTVNSLRGSQTTIRSLNSPAKSPLSFFGNNLKIRSLSTDGAQVSLNSNSSEFEYGVYRRKHLFTRSCNQNRSLKFRSLTNSPFMMRLSLSRVLSRKRIPLSEYSNSNSDLDVGLPSNFSPLRFHDFSNESLPQIDANDSSSSPFQDVEDLRVLLILKNTTDSERRLAVTRFAQHICVVYEYQIGFLQGLKSVHSAADYVAEVLVKAIRIGRITSFSTIEMNLNLLQEEACKPSSQNKCVKTSPMTGTGEQLSWRLSEIWIKPGLRHNEVGGENCHNLNIVTHFLAPCTADLEVKRPDIYGYRNLIVLPNSESSACLKDGSFENSNTNDATIFTNGHNGSLGGSDYYDIFPSDEEIITVSNIRTGSRVITPMSKTQKMNPTTSSPISRADIIKRQQNSKIKSHLLSTSVNLRQHLHRAYRPVFFVIYERPSVIDHLSECESFAAFCKRQNICPVMFLNQDTDLFEGRVCSNLFQHFDIFSLTTNGYMSKAVPDGSFTSPSDSKPLPIREEASRHRRVADVCLGGIDNPGFTS